MQVEIPTHAGVYALTQTETLFGADRDDWWGGGTNSGKILTRLDSYVTGN